MKKFLVVIGLLLLAHSASAQNLVITNARIIDGNGGVIAGGSLVVRDGKIVSVSAGAPSAVPPGAQRIDARGMTVMPGFIDAHRHIIQGDAAQWLAKTGAPQMQQFLDAGFTAVLCAICSTEALDMKQRINAGAVKGPRLFVANIIPLARPAGPPGGGGRRGDPARFDVSRPPLRPTQPAGAISAEDTIKSVDALAKAGFDYIKTVITVTPGGPETNTLKLIISEGKKRNLPTVTHAVSVIDTLAAVEAGPAVLMHTPHIGRLEEDAAAVQKIAKAGIPMVSTLAIFIPHFGPDNTPLFRDGLPFPWDTISSAGQGPVNARLLWENGLTYGYGTDASWPPRDTLKDELRALSLTFSPKDIVSILTRNAARAALRQDQLGTLQPGKLADVVMINGDPLNDIYDVLNVVMTIKGGEVVSDKRAARSTSSR
jgi:imidazolonepropionase-like amidohydrolase